VSCGPIALLAGALGGVGYNDGQGADARFYSPRDVATDSAGNVYVADAYNSTIRKITPAGVVSTFAGTAGQFGSVDGTGSEARFNTPGSVAVDSAGNVYVADDGNYTIRKITPAGVVSTLAGTVGKAGSADGDGIAAQFHFLSGIAADPGGNLYVTDSGSHTIRKITSAGVVSTFAGTADQIGSMDGIGSTALFNQPHGIAIDSAGNVYVADTENQTIRKITPAGVVSTLAGTAGQIGSADGSGSAAQFRSPFGLATDSAGNVYVADNFNYTIRKITPAAVVSTLAGAAPQFGSADGTGSAARFNLPAGLATDSAGNVYVADTRNETIRKITPAAVVSTLAGAAPQFGSVDGIGSAARFNFPAGIATDTAGNVYVADGENSTIRKVTPAGVVSTLAGTAGEVGPADGIGSAARFVYPQGVATDSAGNVYVADTSNYTIRKITPGGVVSTLAGSALRSGSADGIGSDARFNEPQGLATDLAGNVYVADTENHTIRKITPAGMVSTLAGTALLSGSADGIGSAAQFSGPYSVATDSAGNVYVADTGNHTIRKITPAGVVSTLAGTANQFGFADGIGSAARFINPYSVATDSTGNVYVADFGNSLIRRITPDGAVLSSNGSRFLLPRD